MWKQKNILPSAIRPDPFSDLQASHEIDESMIQTKKKFFFLLSRLHQKYVFALQKQKSKNNKCTRNDIIGDQTKPWIMRKTINCVVLLLCPQAKQVCGQGKNCFSTFEHVALHISPEVGAALPAQRSSSALFPIIFFWGGANISTNQISLCIMLMPNATFIFNVIT